MAWGMRLVFPRQPNAVEIIAAPSRYKAIIEAWGPVDPFPCSSSFEMKRWEFPKRQGEHLYKESWVATHPLTNNLITRFLHDLFAKVPGAEELVKAFWDPGLGAILPVKFLLSAFTREEHYARELILLPEFVYVELKVLFGETGPPCIGEMKLNIQNFHSSLDGLRDCVLLSNVFTFPRANISTLLTSTVVAKGRGRNPGAISSCCSTDK